MSRRFLALAFGSLFSIFASTALSQTTQPAGPLGPGDYSRSLMMGDQKREYIIHIPKAYDAKNPTPIVLAIHGAAMNGAMMVPFCGMNKTSDENNFIVVYPSGTGLGPFLTWNAGAFPGGRNRTDDVAFIGKLLDELATLVNVDTKRVYACGMSNGAMMCYRLAAELSDRIAAVAPVAGTIAIAESHPKRAVPVLHFHGTKDPLVPFAGRRRNSQFKSVDDSIQTWVTLDGCDEKPVEDVLSKDGDEMKVTRKTWGGGKDGAEVELVIIEGGGHTWPGKQPPVGFLGKSAMNISANDLIWEFFKKHPMK